MTKLVTALLLSAVLVVPGFAQAQASMKGHMAVNPHAGMKHTGCDDCAGCGSKSMGMGMGQMDKMEGMVKMCLAHVEMMGLNDEQMARVKPIHREMKRKQIQFKSELKLAEMDLAETMEEKDFDLNKASAAVKKIGDIKTRYHLEMLKQMRDVRGVLTDSQFKGTGEEDDEDEEE